MANIGLVFGNKIGNLEVGIKNTIKDVTATTKPLAVNHFNCSLASASSLVCVHKNTIPNNNKTEVNPVVEIKVLICKPTGIFTNDTTAHTNHKNTINKVGVQ